MRGLRLKKSLGQHHLRSPQLCRPLVEFLEPRGYVVEVGPGGGVLTGELLRAGARVLGVELDLAWTFQLSRRSCDPRLSLVALDALRLDWGRLPPGTPVCGNLPYQIATALIEQLLEHGRTVTRGGFLVQEEVADRLLARPGQEAYGAFSVLVQACATPRLLARVKPGSFRPPPRVAGAFVGLAFHAPPFPLGELSSFKRTVRQAFRQRRKTLLNSLAADWGKERARAVLDGAGVDGGLRAESLAVEDFVELHRVAWASAPTAGSGP